MERNQAHEGELMIDWVEVSGSSRVAAIAYNEQEETIYVRFAKDGVEWWYASCPPHVWEQFKMPGTSMGRFIGEVLDNHANGRLS